MAQFAELTTILLLAVAVASLFLSSVLTKRQSRRGNDFEFDNTIATYATRNSPLPYVIGVRRVGAQVASVWGRYTLQESVASVSGGKGGGGGGGGGDITQTVYYENAVHYLAIGRNCRLRGIYQNGELIWEGSAQVTGTFQYEEDLGDEGSFKFRAGTGTVQRPYHRDLNGVPLFANENQYVISVQWNDKRLGGSADWPQMEYLIECLCPDEALPGSAYLIKPAGGDDELDKGVNAAHVVYQLLTAPWPFGANLDTDEVDGQSLKELGYLCEEEGIAVNLVIEGDNCNDVIADLLNMMGVMMSEYQGMLYFRALRPENATYGTLSQGVIEFSEEMVSPPDTEVTVSTGIFKPTRVVLNFPDRTLNFRANQPVSMDNDGQAARAYNVQTQNTAVVTSRKVGDVIASRKLNEVYGDSQGFRLRALYGAHLVLPGDQIDVPDIGQIRVISVEVGDVMTGSVDIECLRDSFGIITTGDGSDVPSDVTSLGVQADRFVDWVEVPVSESGGQVLIVVFRIRTHLQINGANVHVQINSGDYVRTGQQNTPASGGPTRSAISAADGPDIIENGPIVDPYNEDIGTILDLSADLDSWRAGRQLCLINDEVFYLRNVDLVAETEVARTTAYSEGDYVIPPTGEATGLRYRCVTAGTTGADDVPYWPEFTWQDTITDGTVEWQAEAYAIQLKGLIRARFETSARTHPSGSIVAIIEKSNLSAQAYVGFGPETNVCVKTQPFTAREAIDLSLVSAVCKTMEGLGLGDLLVNESGSYYRIEPTEEYIGVNNG